MSYHLKCLAILITLTFITLTPCRNSVHAEEGVIILPERVELTSSESSQPLLLQRQKDKTLGEQVVDGVEWTSEDESIAKVSSTGVVTPVANGTTNIIAKAGEQQVTRNVVVKNLDAAFAWNFRQHVLPALSKAGCNVGACHGALAGKGGFRLSLGAYDPVSDQFNIVKQDRGRRVEFADPGRSLLLAKPTGAVPHKGGLKLDVESRDYRIIAEWIANGASPPSTEEVEVMSIDIFPKRVQLQKGQTQQLLVQANYSNDMFEDVSHWVRWTSTNESVCTVDNQGKITIIGPGEGAVLAWFSSRIVLARITVPYANNVSPEIYATVKPVNFIDTAIDKQLERLNLPPSVRCDDATFIRRAFLDTIGLLPSAEEVKSFIANSSVDKRTKLIDDLLKRPEFVDYWTYKWSDVLMLNGTLLRPEALKAYYKWVHGHVEKNTPWDVMVREILTAIGDSYENGATNFYALYETPEDMTENACSAFMGLSIGCAKCHNHPLEKWTNDQYYAMANMFSRVRSKGWGGERRNGDGKRTTYVVQSGELVQPRTNKPQPPTPLDSTPLAFDASEDRRIALANWMTAPANPYFAKAITNRVWANFFGTGLVEAVDDLRASNPASNEELMEQASQFVIDNKFDLKLLMRECLLSNAYQRSSLPVAGNEADTQFYSRYFPRRLNSEVMHDAVMSVTKVPTKFDSVGFPGADFQATEFYPLGTRATQLYDSAVVSYFLKTFGRNTRDIVCECERSNEPSMVQVLHLSNGDTINDKLSATESRVSDLLAQLESGMSIETLIDEAYLAALARYPHEQERTRFAVMLKEASATDRRLIIEDLFWALMTSREFLFNH